MSRLKQEARSSSGLGLTYKDGKLSEIQVSRGARGTHIAGKGFFGETPRAFLAALERENGEPALVKGPDCLFRNINLCAWAAFEVLPFGRVRFLQEEDEEDEAQDKSILLSSEPLERDDLSDYRPISFFG